LLFSQDSVLNLTKYLSLSFRQYTDSVSSSKMTDIRVKGLKQPMDVAEYLFRRLHQMGVRSMHGVPGDYNLVALDYLPSCGLNWVGSVNELNAG
jgi:hypothetical protein